MIYTKEDALRLVRKWVHNLPSDIKPVTHSVMLYNSLARSDYIPGVSDIDMLAILERKEAIEKLKSYHIDFCENSNLAYEIAAKGQPPEVAVKKDLHFDLWMFTIDDLPDPSIGREGIPYFRQLGTHDFIQNAVPLFGEDIRTKLQPPPIKEAAHEALKSIAKWWDNYYGSITDEELRKDILYRNVPIFLAYIRSALIALVVSFGCGDWRKTTLIENLKRYGPTFPRKNDANETIRLCLHPEKVKNLDLPEVRKLIEKNRMLLDEIIEYRESSY